MKKTKKKIICPECGKKEITTYSDICCNCYNIEQYWIRKQYPYHMSTREIADELGIGLQTVRDTLKRAIRKFNKAWVENYGEYTEELTDQELFNNQRKQKICQSLRKGLTNRKTHGIYKLTNDIHPPENHKRSDGD